MEIQILKGIAGARLAKGVVVVIDVLRAFTTAAYAFNAGLAEIELVSTADEAFAVSGFRMGEIGGRLIPGFDHNNSPSRLIGRQLTGHGVLRTGSGTQCVAAATRASEVWLGSLVVASATARLLKDRHAVTLVASGPPDEGEEDLACAEWIASRLQEQPCQNDTVVTADAFDFAMKVDRQGGRLVARPVLP